MASLSHLTSAHRSRTFCKSTFLWKHIEKKLSYGHFQTQTSRGKKAVYSAEGRRQFILQREEGSLFCRGKKAVYSAADCSTTAIPMALPAFFPGAF